jgi:hypothetical protein
MTRGPTRTDEHRPDGVLRTSIDVQFETLSGFPAIMP